MAIIKVQLLQGRVPQDFQQVRGPIGTFGIIVKAPAVLKRGLWGYTTLGEDGISKQARLCHLSPNFSKNLAFVRGRPYYHLDGSTGTVYIYILYIYIFIYLFIYLSISLLIY